MIQDGKIVVLGKENFFEMSSPMRQESIFNSSLVHVVHLPNLALIAIKLNKLFKKLD